MNVGALNFLKQPPAENWFDYFVNYNKFVQLLQDEKADRTLIGQLFDQFIEHALLVTVSDSKRRRLEQTEVEAAEQKGNKLWLFGWACAARLGWDLNALLKCSNVVRVFSMVSRLFEHTFNVKGETDILSYLSRNEDSVFDSKTSFVTWLYARLVLIIDTQARAPAPPQKPTVSNPNNQIDPALVEAEKINAFVFSVRKHVRNAAAHLERLVTLKLDTFEVPTYHCFQLPDNQNGHQSTSKRREYIGVDAQAFVVRTKCDLMLAHFAATHFVTAKKLAEEVMPHFGSLSKIDSSLDDLFAFDSKKFNGYMTALSKLPKPGIKKPKLDISPYEFNTQRSSSSIKAPDFITNAAVKKACTAYKSAETNEIQLALYLAPTLNQLSVYTDNGPSLWQMLNAFEYRSVLYHYKAFCEWDPSESSFANKIVKGSVSPIFAKILDEAPVDNEPILFYIAQLEKLAYNCDVQTWSAALEPFLDRMFKGKWNKYMYPMCFEVLRVNENVYNRLWGYEKDAKVLEDFLKMLKRLTEDSVKNPNALTTWAFRLIEQTHFVSLLNLELFEAIIMFPRQISSFSSKYLNFARIIATLSAIEKSSDVQWTYLMPLLHRGTTHADRTLAKPDFIEAVELLKNVKVCGYLLSFFVALHNKAVHAGERQNYPYTENMKAKYPHIVFINKQIFDLNPIDVPALFANNSESIDMNFVTKIIEILLRNMRLSLTNNSIVLCQLADFLYAHERYEEAAQLYTTILNAFERGLCEMSDYDKIVTDLMVSKLIHCFYELKLFTLAVIMGQLLRDIRVHVQYYIPSIIKQTTQINDGGKAYYPYIYSIPIFEAMSDAYDRNNMNVYYITLQRLCTTRSLTQANSADVIREETARRRLKFVEIVYKTMKNRPSQLPFVLEKHQLVANEA